MHFPRCIRFAFLFSAIVFLAKSAAYSQTDIGLSLYGAFSGATNGSGVQQSPSNSAGGIVELRHISNPLVGYEATYSYNRANQVYSYTFPPPCPTSGCHPRRFQRTRTKLRAIGWSR